MHYKVETLKARVGEHDEKWREMQWQWDERLADIITHVRWVGNDAN